VARVSDREFAAQKARLREQRIYAGLRRHAKTPTREKIGRLINPVLVPTWRIIGSHDVLAAIKQGGFYRRDQVERCRDEARQAIVLRGRTLLLVRDQWKNGLYPSEPGPLVSILSGVLRPFYIATGAAEELDSLLDILV
jgi:hypothetical protein